MPIGDVHSNDRGSGARYNDGKPDLSLIPLDIIAESYDEWWICSDDGPDVSFVLGAVGCFQTTGDVNHLISASAELRGHWRDCARVFEYGRKKYAAWNWAKGMNWSIPVACIGRHALTFLEGEEIDQESGLPHVGHILCNLVMLRHYAEHFPEGNDLPPPEHFAAIPSPPEYDPRDVAFRHAPDAKQSHDEAFDANVKWHRRKDDLANPPPSVTTGYAVPVWQGPHIHPRGASAELAYLARFGENS